MAADNIDTVVITGVPFGEYEITESDIYGYEFLSGTGEFCQFDGDLAYANVSVETNPVL